VIDTASFKINNFKY